MSATPPDSQREWGRKDLLDVASLEAWEVRRVLDTAEPFREVAGRAVKKVPALRGKTVFHLTYPGGAGVASPAAALAAAGFDLAARRLSADSVVVDVSAEGAGAAAAVADTLAELDGLAADLVVLRHPEAGLARGLAGGGEDGLSAGLVNAGDGAHEEPVAGLAHAFTLRRMLGDGDRSGDAGGPSLDGARVALIGDLADSAAFRSTLHALTALGAIPVAAGLHTRVPAALDRLGAEVAASVDDAVEGAEAVVVFPPPSVSDSASATAGEGRDYPSGREYHRLAGLTRERLERTADGAPVLHAGPPARGASLAADVADASAATRRAQAGDALAVRMAVLYLLAGHRDRARARRDG